MRIVRNIIFRLDRVIRKITPTAARHEDFFAGPVGVVDHLNTATPLGRFYGAHQARSTRAYYQYINLSRRVHQYTAPKSMLGEGFYFVAGAAF